MQEITQLLQNLEVEKNNLKRKNGEIAETTTQMQDYISQGNRMSLLVYSMMHTGVTDIMQGGEAVIQDPTNFYKVLHEAETLLTKMEVAMGVGGTDDAKR